jgi:molecular chaperone GrpE
MNNKEKKNGKDKDSNEIKIERGSNNTNSAETENKKQNEQSVENELLEPAPSASIEDNPEYKALKQQNDSLTNEVSELKDRLLRKAAEFENYKRRTENEQLNFLKYAAESFIGKVLPVYDDLERSLAHINESSNIETIKSGLDMIFSKFSKVLEEQGVKKIEAKGMPFDFNFHEALLQQTVQGVAPHTVIEVVEPGYMYKDKVIRHAKVIVSDENSAA